MNIPATVITAVLCFGITALLGFVAIPALRKLKFGQTILDIGPAWHKSKTARLQWAVLCSSQALLSRLRQALR